jgi:hypothetical protein
MKYVRAFSIACLLGLLYSSCVKKENYPNYPIITYNSYIPFCSGSITDSAYIRVNFTDGNGEIGYPAGDASAPSDFFIMPMLYVNKTKSFQPITGINGDTINFSYQIPDITPTGSDKELNGIIQINLETAISTIVGIADSFGSGLVNVNEIQFQVWMYDRNNIKSNVLITPVISNYACQ